MAFLKPEFDIIVNNKSHGCPSFIIIIVNHLENAKYSHETISRKAKLKRKQTTL